MSYGLRSRIGQFKSWSIARNHDAKRQFMTPRVKSSKSCQPPPHYRPHRRERIHPFRTPANHHRTTVYTVGNGFIRSEPLPITTALPANLRRGEPTCSPVALSIIDALTVESVGAGYILPVAPCFSDTPSSNHVGAHLCVRPRHHRQIDVYRSVVCCIKSVIANQCAHWCGNPFSFGTTVK